MKYILLILTVFTISQIFSFAQKPIYVWDEISFMKVKIPNLDNTVLYDKDTIVSGRLIPSGSLTVQLKGKIINSGDSIINLRRDLPGNYFKIEYRYRNKTYNFFLDYFLTMYFKDILTLNPNSEEEICLITYLPFKNNKEIYKENKTDFLKEILEILPTIVIKGRFAVDYGNFDNIHFFDFESDNVRSVNISWDNYIPLTN
jgi:hypothetical protein